MPAQPAQDAIWVRRTGSLILPSVGGGPPPHKEALVATASAAYDGRRDERGGSGPFAPGDSAEAVLPLRRPHLAAPRRPHDRTGADHPLPEHQRCQLGASLHAPEGPLSHLGVAAGRRARRHRGGHTRRRAVAGEGGAHQGPAGGGAATARLPGPLVPVANDAGRGPRLAGRATRRRPQDGGLRDALLPGDARPARGHSRAPGGPAPGPGAAADAPGQGAGAAGGVGAAGAALPLPRAAHPPRAAAVPGAAAPLPPLPAAPVVPLRTERRRLVASLQRGDVGVVGLAAVDHLHLQAGALPLQGLSQGMGDLGGHVFAVVEGEEAVAPVQQVEGAAQGGLRVVGAGLQLAVHQGDVVPFLHLQVADAHGPHRAGDLDGAHGCRRLLHRLEVLLQVAAGAEGKDGGDALGDRGGGEHLHPFAGHARRLLGGQDDVLVVGQDDDVLGGGGLDGLQQLAGAGVHGGAAAHHDGPQAAEGLGQAVARGHRHHRRRRLQRLLQLEEEPRLLADVLDAHLQQFAYVGADADGAARVVGMDVGAHQALVAHGHHRVAHLLQTGADGLGPQRLSGHQELGAVAVEGGLGGVQLLGLLQPVALDVGRGQGGRLLQRLPAQVPGDGVQEQPEALAAGVHHPCLGQDGQQLRRPLHRLPGDLGGGGQQGHQVALARLEAGADGLGRLAGHSEHRPLAGVGHRLVGQACCLLQAGGQRLGVQLAAVAGGLGQPPHHLREDDARVAAGTHQGAPRQRLHQLAQGHLAAGGVEARRLLQGGAEGEEHVGAGVAVGDGVDVDGVEGLHLPLEAADGRLQGPEDVGSREGGDRAGLTAPRTASLLAGARDPSPCP